MKINMSIEINKLKLLSFVSKVYAFIMTVTTFVWGIALVGLAWRELYIHIANKNMFLPSLIEIIFGQENVIAEIELIVLLLTLYVGLLLLKAVNHAPNYFYNSMYYEILSDIKNK
jgi:hypothetical protein